MKINLTEVEIPEETKKLLNQFFIETGPWLYNTDLLDYHNIKIFGNLLREFIKSHHLESNYIFKLFLLEIKYDELTFKITEDCEWIQRERMPLPASLKGKHKVLLTPTIKKWLYESTAPSKNLIPKK